jgi:hypothetical protein
MGSLGLTCDQVKINFPVGWSLLPVAKITFFKGINKTHLKMFSHFRTEIQISLKVLER